jgi:hypothetical protein
LRESLLLKRLGFDAGYPIILQFQLLMNRTSLDRWLLGRIERRIRSEMPKAKPPEDKCVLLLKKILARLDAMDDLSPELEKQLDINRRLVRGIDRMVPDRPTKKEH